MFRFAIALLLASSTVFGSGMPDAVKDKDFVVRVGAVNTALASYRQLPEWSGTFHVESATTKEYCVWEQTERKIKSVPTVEVCIVKIAVIPNKTVLTCERDDLAQKPHLDQIKRLLFFSDVNEEWSSYAGEEPGEVNTLCILVKSDHNGWKAVYLDQGKGYLPAKIVEGTSPLEESALTLFSDFRRTASGRWVAWKMVVTDFVPGTERPGRIDTVTIEKFCDRTETPAK